MYVETKYLRLFRAVKLGDEMAGECAGSEDGTKAVCCS
jgi:hypothetical protein